MTGGAASTIRCYFVLTVTPVLLASGLVCQGEPTNASAAEVVATTAEKSNVENSAASEAKTVPVDSLTAEQLSARIDELLGEVWQRKAIIPAQISSDEEFVRRIHLDLIGRIPSAAETFQFLADQHPHKRALLVTQLLERGAWATHFANTWRDLLLAGTTAPEVRNRSFGLEMWLRLRFAVNMPFDRIVKELLSPASVAQRTDLNEPSPAAFYQAAEGKPEVLAASTSRIFLGMQLQCAQCHDHPFTAWKQRQFWEFAAFFQESDPALAMQKPGVGEPEISADSLKIPETNVTVTPLYLDGSKPSIRAGEAKRDVLARWITSPENPYFARATVNRMWDHFFGRGFVHPVDNLDPSNAPAHTELFQLMTRQFIIHRYDMKYLVQSIVGSKAYQRSGRLAKGAPLTREQAEQQLIYFAHMPLRRMTSDQLFASFVEATGYQEAGTMAGGQTAAREEFQNRFTDTSVPRTEVPTSILQALALMNGKHVANATDLKQSRALTAIAEAPYLDSKGRVELLFVMAFSRKPTEHEQAEMTAQLAARRDEKAALADIFWALLNSAEFVLNH